MHEASRAFLSTAVHQDGLVSHTGGGRQTLRHPGGVGRAVRRSWEFEDQYWMSDNIHDALQPVIINIDSDDEDGDDDFFLESDCE